MNIGEAKLPKKKPKICSTEPLVLDIQLPCLEPYHWAHMGKPPDSNQHIALMEYKQKKEGEYVRSTEEASAQLKKDKFNSRFDRHTEMKRFRNEIKKRVNIKMQEYDDQIEKRREKLKELYATEEREFYKETIDTAQRGGETRDAEMMAKIESLIAKREAERLKVVEEKRLLQYMNRCVDLRTEKAKKNLIESKNGQLQQIRENQARRQMEKELDNFWYELTLKDIEAKKEREENEAIERYIIGRSNMTTWEMQLRGKEMLKEEKEKLVEEEKEELAKLQEELKREELEAIWSKERRRQQAEKDFREQLEIREKLLSQRKKEEDSVIQAYTLLNQMELNKELNSVTDNSASVKKEMAQYQAYLKELAMQRKEEEDQANQLILAFQKEMQKKKDDAQCKIEFAKRQLQRDVMKGRAEQLRYKQELAQEQLKLQQAENDMLRIACETNAKLQAERGREEYEAKMKYQHDLLKQIEYNKLLQEREREELERQLAIGLEEEERYLKMTKELCSADFGGKKHPFRVVIERPDCHCPPIGKNSN